MTLIMLRPYRSIEDSHCDIVTLAHHGKINTDHQVFRSCQLEYKQSAYKTGA